MRGAKDTALWTEVNMSTLTSLQLQSANTQFTVCSKLSPLSNVVADSCKYHLKCTLPFHPFTSVFFSVALTPSSCPCLVLWHSRTFCAREKGISCHISMLTLPFTLGHRWCPGRSTHACTICIHIN